MFGWLGKKSQEPVRTPEQQAAITASQHELANRLAMLGGTSREVAEMLFSLDVRGVRNTEKGCPVSNWLRRQYNTTDVSVYQRNIYVRGVHIPIPGVIAEFINDFDAGVYPQLRRRQQALGLKPVPAPSSVEKAVDA